MLMLIGALLLGIALGSVVLIAWTRMRPSHDQDAAALSAQSEAERIIEEARRSELLAKEAELKAKDLLVEARATAERELRDSRRELTALETKLQNREETLEKRLEAFERRDADLNRRDQALRNREKALTDKETERQALVDEARARLEAVAGLTRDEAKRTLIEEMVGQARQEAARHIRIVEEEAREEADRRAKRIISIAIERLAGEFVAERTVSVLALPNDEMKGRIIGREGRNIRAIEAATGVDIIIDDTPEAVVISCHNPIRREIARVSLERLISDGRIHPGRIEEVVRKGEQEVEESIKEAGQRALIEVGVHGVHPELSKLLGMLKYRYSYAQNVLMHSIEAAFICGAMAAELGLNEKQALYPTREYKKARINLFSSEAEEWELAHGAKRAASASA